MPAIDPARLDEKLAGISALIGQPEEMLKELEALFEFYADRTRRSPAVARATDSVSHFGAPEPVVRRAQRSIHHQVVQNELDPEPLIECFWHAGEREMRLLAVGLMTELPWLQAVEWAEEMAETTQDPKVIQSLSQQGLAGWREISLEEVLPLMRIWLHRDSQSFQLLALQLLREQLEAATSDQVLEFLRVLSGSAGRVRTSARAELQNLFRRLAELNPPETAQFLLDEGRSHHWEAGYQSLVKEALESFPGAQQQEIRAALMAQ
ncbi:MAG: DNA alkylation repair protein [Anaerolineales bacterium]